MRICGKQFRATEIFIFVVLYVLANYGFLKLQQNRHYQEQLRLLQEKAEREEAEANAKVAAAESSDGKSPLAGLEELSLPTEDPQHYENQPREEWKFDEGANQHVLGVDEPQPRPRSSQGMEDVGMEDYSDEEEFGEENDPNLKTILFWNPMFTSIDYRFGFGHKAFLEAKCPVHTCRTTNDRRQLLNADAVVFHGPRIEGFPPPERRKDQVYVYVQQEPHFIMSQEEMPHFRNAMNLTMTHRTDSDIYIPYGRVVYSEDAIKKHPIHVNPRSRPKSVVWASSHCSTPSRRELYVRELQKYIDIDIYGTCGDLECSREDYLYCYSKFEKEYRFYMALENNYCKDYISEKVYRPLLYKMVPIVFGGGNYTQGTPPHSVIDINNYPHPRDLAKYLNYLSNNDKAYNRYFAWKTSGYELEHQRKVIMGDAFCRLCEILHDPNYKYRDYRDLKSWWTNNMCDPFTVQRWRKKNKW